MFETELYGLTLFDIAKFIFNKANTNRYLLISYLPVFRKKTF